MEFKDGDMQINVTYEVRDFNNTEDKSICIYRSKNDVAIVSVARIDYICKNHPNHRTAYLKNMLAVLKDISKRDGFDDFNGDWLVDQLIPVCMAKLLVHTGTVDMRSKK